MTDCHGYRKQQMISVNILRMSVMLANRRSFRADRKLNYLSVRAYQAFLKTFNSQIIRVVVCCWFASRTVYPSVPSETKSVIMTYCWFSASRNSK